MADALPGKVSSGGYVYVLAFSNGTIKVGRTANPRSRVANLMSTAAAFGARVTDRWISPLHGRHDLSEASLLEAVYAMRPSITGHEWFTGLRFREVVERAEELNLRPVGPGPTESAAHWCAPDNCGSELDLDSIEQISVADRLMNLGRGVAVARLFWFAILAHTPWTPAKRPTWAGNATLANECGLLAPSGEPDTKMAERGIRALQSAGMLTTRHGLRPGARRRYGRILEPAISAPVKVLVPDARAMAAAFARLRAHGSKRPAATVATLQALSVLAGSPTHSFEQAWPQVTLPVGQLMRFCGVRGRTAHGRRVELLLRAGLVRWTSSGIAVAPTSLWSR